MPCCLNPACSLAYTSSLSRARPRALAEGQRSMARALAKDPTAYARSARAVSRLTPSVSTPTLLCALLTPCPIGIATSEMGTPDTWARRPAPADAGPAPKGADDDAAPPDGDTTAGACHAGGRASTGDFTVGDCLAGGRASEDTTQSDCREAIPIAEDTP
jgi:hypothetical protein